MRTGYFCLQSSWRIHLVHELELIQTDLDNGAEVHVVPPGRLLRFLDTAPWVDYKRRGPADRRLLSDSLSLLSAPVTVHDMDRLIRSAASFPNYRAMQWPELTDHDALNGFRFESYECGNAVLSSLVYHKCSTNLELGEYQPWIRNALDTSIKVYLAARAFIADHRPDRVYVFNGRMASYRGVLRACQETDTECVVHERGATRDRICMSTGTMPHDVFWLQKEIPRHWSAGGADEETAREIGRSFYTRKREGQVFNSAVFTRDQQDGLLPEGFDRRRKIYTIFTSSEYERFCLSQYYRYLPYDDQLEGILDVVAVLREHRFDGKLYIRIHPNSLDEKPCMFEALRRLVTDDFVEILPADSPVDTYALLDASEKVFSFGSTVAMEAAFWGKPSVSFATSAYQTLEATYEPRDREDAVRLIVDDLEPRGAEDCLKYGYYYSTFGRKLRYSEIIDSRNMSFRGVPIRKSSIWRSAMRLYRWVRNAAPRTPLGRPTI